MDPMKILLVNRQLNIGGVETYLYRLCDGLVSRGHQVGLLTEGGFFEDRIASSGTRLHRVGRLDRDWKSVVGELGSAGYQIVHAHNYHSARVGQHLARQLGIPYLMSVHGPRSRLKQLFFRQWSPQVVVMSEGDRDNIAWPGGVRADRIHLSFYGIDTARFRPGLDASAVATELGFSGGEIPIVFISRFSNRKADVGHALLDAAPRLLEQQPLLRFLLVGEGPESAGLASHVEQLNQSQRRRVAQWVGPRGDVPLFMTLASICVCTANTALEAMACGTPTIAAGRTGYFGRVQPARFDAAKAICFADHGRSPSALSAEGFLQDLSFTLAHLTEARAESGLIARRIAEEFTVAKMTEDMESLYRKILRTGGY